jgi:CheY-like chemotaxis protein
LKVLIAEDDAISRMILKKSVEKFGHECLTAEAEVSSTRIASSGSRRLNVLSITCLPNCIGCLTTGPERLSGEAARKALRRGETDRTAALLGLRFTEHCLPAAPTQGASYAYDGVLHVYVLPPKRQQFTLPHASVDGENVQRFEAVSSRRFEQPACSSTRHDIADLGMLGSSLRSEGTLIILQHPAPEIGHFPKPRSRNLNK